MQYFASAAAAADRKCYCADDRDGTFFRVSDDRDPATLRRHLLTRLRHRSISPDVSTSQSSFEKRHVIPGDRGQSDQRTGVDHERRAVLDSQCCERSRDRLRACTRRLNVTRHARADEHCDQRCESGIHGVHAGPWSKGGCPTYGYDRPPPCVEPEACHLSCITPPQLLSPGEAGASSMQSHPQSPTSINSTRSTIGIFRLITT